MSHPKTNLVRDVVVPGRDNSRRRPRTGEMTRTTGPRGRPGRIMGRRRIRPANVDGIVREIRVWDAARGPLTWVAVVGIGHALFGHRWSRQALEAHVEIKGAFQDAQDEKSRRAKRRTNDEALAELRRQVADRDARIARLNKTLGEYDARFARWTYNAFVNGLTDKELDQPLPPVDRGQTDPALRGGVR